MNECWVKDCPKAATEVIHIDGQDFFVCRDHYASLNATKHTLRVKKS